MVRADAYTWLPAERPARTRNGWIVFLASLATIGVYAIYWIYRLQREYPRRRRIDPKAALWLSVYVAFIVLMFAAFIASGALAEWTHWPGADFRQRSLFAAALFTGVLFNVWFAYGCVRLTDRFRLLAGKRVGRVRGVFTRYAMMVGMALEMVAMITPLMARVSIITLPDNADYAAELVGKIGTGTLFAWAISIHGIANTLARAEPGERTDSGDVAAEDAG